MNKNLHTTLIIILAAIFFLPGCGKDDQPEPEIRNTMPPSRTDASGENIGASPAVDASVIIAGLQQDLEPSGLSLTENQQERITEAFNPESPSDTRLIFDVLTTEQKQVLVAKIRGWLEGSAHPFTDEQVARYMAIGPGSKDEAPTDILTIEQIQIIMRAARESVRQQQGR